MEGNHRRMRDFAIAMVAALTMFAAVPVSAAPETGKPAPDFTATASSGKTVKLSDFKGKIVVLEWTNDGCPYVQKHYGSGNMQPLQKAAAADGVVWLSVISSAKGAQGHVTGPEADKLTVSRGAAPAAVLLDPEGTLGRLYKAETTPHMYIVDKTGTLVYMGGIDDKPNSDPAAIKGARNYVRQALDELRAGKPVSEPVTQPYGCSVKYK
jgi:hypothetical protein